MKTLKKIISTILVATLVFTFFAITSSAAPVKSQSGTKIGQYSYTATLTYRDNANKTFEAGAMTLPIGSGTVSCAVYVYKLYSDGDYELVNSGSGVTSATVTYDALSVIDSIAGIGSESYFGYNGNFLDMPITLSIYTSELDG